MDREHAAGLMRYQWILFFMCLTVLACLSAAYCIACQRDFWCGRTRAPELCTAASV